MAATDMPTIAHHVPIVMPVITSPIVETMQAANRCQRRSFKRSERSPHPTKVRDHRQPTDRHVAGIAQGLDDLRDKEQHSQTAHTRRSWNGVAFQSWATVRMPATRGGNTLSDR